MPAALCNELGVERDRLIVPRQTHSVDAIYVDGSFSPEGVDGLVADRPGLALCINTADCVPVVMSDPVAGVYAACHAGWRGAVGGIVEHTLDAMIERGAAVERIYAAMGPCICAECFEVGEEVAEQFERWPGSVVRKKGWSKPHVDLAAAIKAMLRARGVARVAPPPECSRCNWERLWSARRLGISSGRLLTFITR